MTEPPIGRLAPTPSGLLHLGNVVAFAAAWMSVRGRGGQLLLRIEDVDQSRARPEIADQQRRDLEWLGLDWDTETLPQASRDYAPWLGRLAGQTYRCVCSRKQIQAAGGTYPGTCRDLGLTEGSVRFRLPQEELTFEDLRWGRKTYPTHALGDPVLMRRDGSFAYPLAVVADDIADGVTEVARGSDLLPHTVTQIYLWRAFGASPPAFLHTPLILGPDATKLAKRHAATSVADLRARGWSAGDIWEAVLPWLGLSPFRDVAHAAKYFKPGAGPLGPLQLLEIGEPGSLLWRVHEGPPS